MDNPDDPNPEEIQKAAEKAADSIIKLLNLRRKTENSKLTEIASYLGLDSEKLKGRPVTFKADLSLEEMAIKDSLPIDYQTAYHKARTEPYVDVNAYYGKKIREIYKILQEGKCAFCFLPFGEDAMDLDHSHMTGLIRGVVHHKCNSFFGFAEKAAIRMKRSTDEVCDMLKAYLNTRRSS